MEADEEWQSPAESVDMAAASPRRRSTRKRAKVNYVKENSDSFFEAYPGITHFGRTRKGGDNRPRAREQAVVVVRVSFAMFCLLCVSFAMFT